MLLLYPHLPTTPASYLTIALPGVPALVSILWAVGSVMAVLLLHEGVHATVFYCRGLALKATQRHAH